MSKGPSCSDGPGVTGGLKKLILLNRKCNIQQKSTIELPEKRQFSRNSTDDCGFRARPLNVQLSCEVQLLELHSSLEAGFTPRSALASLTLQVAQTRETDMEKKVCEVTHRFSVKTNDQLVAWYDSILVTSEATNQNLAPIQMRFVQAAYTQKEAEQGENQSDKGNVDCAREAKVRTFWCGH